MRKLTHTEELAYEALVRHGSYCPGTNPISHDEGHHLLKSTMDMLVKKKRAVAEMTDDGVKYTPVSV